MRFRVLCCRQLQFLAAALEVAQHRIDESAGVRKTARRDGDGFIDRGIGGRQPGIEFVQANQQMAIQFIGLHWTLGQLREEETQTTGLAQDAISQILRSRQVAGVRGCSAAQVGECGGKAVSVAQDGVDQVGGEQARIRHAAIVAQAGLGRGDCMCSRIQIRRR